MVDWGTITISIVSAIIVAWITPWFTHKFSVKYFKKEYFFKRKIELFEKIGEYTWRNHLSLTTLKVLGEKNIHENKGAVKLKMIEDLNMVINILDKAMYLPKDLTFNLGKYTTLFENHIYGKEFGEKEAIEKLKKETSEYTDKINAAIKREIESIK